ncbi:hypothetical protein Fot_09988 [Forsythia ovata]|uniref:Uncharacterized protein n=1 Tax=Forsythia ovata TaxID=205694 RepID=A0ABD1WFJ0_9LAMI
MQNLHYTWLDVNLYEIEIEGNSLREIISELSDAAKHGFMELRKEDAISCLRDGPFPSKWLIKVLAANSIYRICQTLMLNLDNKWNKCRNTMFEILSSMIADVIGLSP